MEHSTNGVSGSGIFHSLFRRDAMYKIVIITYFSQEVGAQGRRSGPGCDGSLD